MNNLQVIENKILDITQLDISVSRWHFFEKKIVFTNGVFDLIHPGHIDYLAHAKDLGDILIVGVNTDKSVKTLGKGASRPINNEYARSLIIAALHFVDVVVLFDEETPYNLIKKIQPDVLVKGSDYKPEEIVGYDIVKASGGEIATLEFLPGYSTTSIEKKIKDAK